jgi:hypothetical protein
MCNQEDKENAGYENFDNANIVAARKAAYKTFMNFQKVPHILS